MSAIALSLGAEMVIRQRAADSEQRHAVTRSWWWSRLDDDRRIGESGRSFRRAPTTPVTWPTGSCTTGTTCPSRAPWSSPP